jgi:hypothetical protein
MELQNISVRKMRNAYKIFFGKKAENKRSFRRPRQGWEVGNRMDLKHNKREWIR